MERSMTDDTIVAEPEGNGLSREEKRRITAEAGFLEHVGGPAIAELNTGLAVIEVAPELAAKDWRSLMRIGGAVVAGKTLVIVVPEGQRISAKLFAAADYLVGGDNLNTPEGKARTADATALALARLKVKKP
jgi:hypothetical protein